MRKNPSVNRWLDDREIDRIDHALGRPRDPLRESYRNYYAINVDTKLAKEFKASPFWQIGHVDAKGMAFFHVTDTGRKALADYLNAHKTEASS